uniref:Uncharacterized protein n=1 Tax=Oryza sativa subsp. japonica TaxID=39947 RepID=Q851W7_ORYSJ|nr:hypothetical protein [Oryza sativa Japonica Group]
MANRLAATGRHDGDIWKSTSLKRKSKRYDVNFFKGFKATAAGLAQARQAARGEAAKGNNPSLEDRWIGMGEDGGVAMDS